MRDKKAIFAKIHYLCSGLIIISSGSIQSETYPALGLAAVLFGIVLLGYFIFCIMRHHSFAKMDALVNFLEGSAYIITGVIYYQEGKDYIQYSSFFAALLLITSAVILSVKGNKIQQKRA